MALKKKDFVEIDYTAKLDSGDVFDTTNEAIAKDAGIFSEEASYSPLILCVGEGFVIKGLDDALVGKDLGEHKIEIDAESAFGKKSAKLIQMIPAKRFKEQKIEPVPGLRLNIDGRIGIVRSVSAGRIIVDFNHPLSGHDVTYEIKINRVVDDKKEQVGALLKSLTGLDKIDVEIKDNKAVVTFPAKLPDEVLKGFSEKVKDLCGVEAEFKASD